MEKQIRAIASSLNEVKLSFYKAKVKKKNMYLLAINFNIPRKMVKTEQDTYNALHFLFWCLLQQLQLSLPMSYRMGHFSISCNTLLRHKDTGQTRIFRQSFNSQAIDYNVLQQFRPIISRSAMAKDIYRLCKNEQSLNDTINIPISRDSNWSLIGCLSIVVNCQVWLNLKQITKIGMAENRMRHYVVRSGGSKLSELK